jgi:hypothetical protein
MSPPLSDTELLEMLAGALAPAPVVPTPAEREQLRRVLASDLPSFELDVLSPRKVIPLRRLRRPIVAAVAAAVLTTGGAAAAVESNTLPGPLRNIAVAVGLPVTSPTLEQVDNDLAALRAALSVGDVAAIRADVAMLRRDLDALGPADRATAAVGANLLLAQADGWLTAHPSASEPAASGQSATPTDEDGGASEGHAGGIGTGGTNETDGVESAKGSPHTNAQDQETGGDDASGTSTNPGPPSGGTSGGGPGSGVGDTGSGAAPATGQSTVNPDGDQRSSGEGSGGGGSSITNSGGSSSDGSPSSTSGGGVSSLSGDGSTSSANASISSGSGDGGGG